MKRNLLLLLTITLFVAACDDDPATTPDAAASDTLATLDTNTTSDGLNADGPGADAQTTDSATSDTASTDGPAADAAAPTKTPCGSSLQCDSVTEVCVVNEAQLKTHVCKAVPKGCEQKRTCACLGASVCTGVFKLCNDNPASNTVTCSCPNC
jgi:hypothetical protein